jgi:hypothetical protein
VSLKQRRRRGGSVLVEASHAGSRGRTSSIPRNHFGDQRVRRKANRRSSTVGGEENSEEQSSSGRAYA